MTATPADLGLEYEGIPLKTADGLTLSAWYIPSENRRGVFLYCHGNAGNISGRHESIELFHRLRMDTLVFDYRGYGASEGKPSERGTYLDAEAAWDYLTRTRNLEPSQIIILGRSLGAAIAIKLASEHTPRALIAESTFTSVPDLASNVYPILPVKLLTRFKYNSIDKIGRVNCPLLMVHSVDDELIPFEHGKKLFEKHPGPKEFFEITGTHMGGLRDCADAYENCLDRFLTKILRQ